MNQKIDTERESAQGGVGGVGGVLHAVFQEWVFHAALTCLVVVAVVNGFASLNSGTLV